MPSPPAQCSIFPAAARRIRAFSSEAVTGSDDDSAPFFARALFPQDALTVEGESARYPSSATLERVFCKTCGTRLMSWRTNGTAAGVALATFDDRNAFAPTEHIWVSEKMHWVKLDDGLPQYPEQVP